MSHFEAISGKKLWVMPLDPFIQTPLFFFEIEKGILKTLCNYYILNELKSIQKRFFKF
jgi:hypothetical protein